VTKNYSRAEIYINRGNKEQNKEVYDFIYKEKEKIESDFGNALEWERMDDNVTSRIKFQKNNVNVFEQDDWGDMILFLIDASTRMEEVFRKRSNAIKTFLKS